LAVLLKDHAVAVFNHYDTLLTSGSYTTTLDSSLCETLGFGLEVYD